MTTSTQPVSAAQLVVVFDELRKLAARALQSERPGHTLQTTALVNETLLQLMGQRWEQKVWSEPQQFFADFARKMRQVLVDHARARLAAKRVGGRQRVPLTDIMALYEDTTGLIGEVSELLDRMAAAPGNRSGRQARVAELKIFGDRTQEEDALVLG